MRGYIKYFKTQAINELQYKAAAFAGVSTQVFWGFLNTMVFVAFYSHVSTSVDITLPQLITYVWLNQAFLRLVYVRVIDSTLLKQIKNGNVAYELCRPYNLYNWWFIKYFAQKYASVLLRCIPIIILGILLPAPYTLLGPYSALSFILFIISLILGSLVLIAIQMIILCIAFFTNEGKGISDILFIIGDILAGAVFPLPLMPKIVQRISSYLPFRLIADLPFRVYSGNINIDTAFTSIIAQIIWLIILLILGQLIMKVALRKVCIQGG